VFQLVGEVRQVVAAKAVKLDERTSGSKGWSRTLLDVPLPSWTKVSIGLRIYYMLCKKKNIALMSLMNLKYNS
jgi:hypothetical protein